MLHPLLTATEPPAWIIERLARPERAPLPPVDGFVFDRPEALAAAWGHIARLLREGDIPAIGNRDDHLHRFLAKMHGVGIGRDNAHELYDQFLQASDGAAPEGWPTDEKSWEKINRIWDNPHGTYNAPGSELLPIVPFASVAAPEEDATPPAERRWRGRSMVQLVAEPPIPFYDEAKTLPIYRNGGVGMTYGPGNHHKSNVWISRAFELWTAYPELQIVFASGEGAQGLGARFEAQCRYRNVSAFEYERRFLSTAVPLVGDKADMESYAEYLVGKGFDRPAFILIDTFATALAGMDEDHKAAALLTENGLVGMLARALKCFICVIHHTGKDRKAGMRGAVGFGWNVDMVSRVEANADNGAAALTWHVERMKDGAGGHDIHYAIEYGYGVPIPVPTSKLGYEMLTGDAKWDRNTVAAALGRLGPGSWHTDVVVMEIYARGDMDPEDWQNRCRTLARRMERANAPDIAHLREDIGGVVKWRVPPV